MHVQVEVETITPLFLAGADPRGVPELRAPSVRGALRYWLRALLGGVLGDQDLNALRKAEAQVFGSTDRASPVVVRVHHDPASPIGYSRLTRNRAGVAYLFFGARRFGGDPERQAFPSGFRFGCQLDGRAGVQDENEKALQAATASLWLLTHLGSLGMRARRGGGSLQGVSTDGNDSSLLPLVSEAQTAKELQETLQDGLHRLREWASITFNGSLTPSLQSPPAFDVLHPKGCSIHIVHREFSDWADALDAFGQAMQRFRNRREPDYSNVKAVVQGRGQLQPVQRAAFGLPIGFSYRSLGQRATLEGERHDRRASPLRVRVTRLANGRCVLVLTHFRSSLLPPGERLQLKGRGHPKKADPPSQDLVAEFIHQLSGDFGTGEVTGW